MSNNRNEYLQFPLWLLDAGVSRNGMLVYMLISNRIRLSEKYGWQDHGRPYCIYTVDELGEKLKLSYSHIQRSLAELRRLGLLEYRRLYTGANAHFLGPYTPEDVTEASPEKSGNLADEAYGTSQGKRSGHRRRGASKSNQTNEKRAPSMNGFSQNEDSGYWDYDEESHSYVFIPVV